MSQKKTSTRRGFLQTSVLAATTLTLAPFESRAEHNRVIGKKGNSETLPDRTLFAFDDHSIPWQHNLKVTLVEAMKHPSNPVLRKGPKGSPDHGHAILYGTVIKDGGKFRMWYLGMSQSDTKEGPTPGFWRPMCYAESTDGIKWVKPDLGLVDFNGSKHNNICLIEGEPYSLTRVNDFLSILYEPDDPDPRRRYKGVYIAHVPYDDIAGGMSNIGVRERRICSFICAASPDGLTWQVMGDRPVNASGERFEVTSLFRFGDFYYSTGQLISPWATLPDGSKAGRVMLTYRSPDFVNWSKAKAFAFARTGQLVDPPVKGQQTHMGAGLWNRNNVIVGLYGMWQDGLPASERPKGASPLLGTTIDLGLVVSNDGIHFREPVPNFKTIPRGKPGDWDDTALLQGHAFVNEGDQTMIWYSHWDTSMNLRSMEIGLATLRRDGFGYLSRNEDDNDAHFITASLEAGKRERLIINADGISKEAPLSLEILDKHDKPLAGYSGTAAAVLTSPGTQLEVSWAGKKYLPENQKFSVRVNFPLNSSARVYALYLSQQ